MVFIMIIIILYIFVFICCFVTIRAGKEDETFGSQNRGTWH